MKSYMLNKVIAWLLGGDFFNSIKDIVLALSSSNVPGSEKRKIAIEKAKKIAGTTAMFAINLAIEAAVFLLKEQAAKGKLV